MPWILAMSLERQIRTRTSNQLIFRLSLKRSENCWINNNQNRHKTKKVFIFVFKV